MVQKILLSGFGFIIFMTTWMALMWFYMRSIIVSALKRHERLKNKQNQESKDLSAKN